MISDDRWWGKQFISLIQFNAEQSKVFVEVMAERLSFFLDVQDGTGKTFLINLLRAYVILPECNCWKERRWLTALSSCPINLIHSKMAFFNIGKQSDIAQVLLG